MLKCKCICCKEKFMGKPTGFAIQTIFRQFIFLTNTCRLRCFVFLVKFMPFSSNVSSSVANGSFWESSRVLLLCWIFTMKTTSRSSSVKSVQMQSFLSIKENGHDEDAVLERKPIATKFKCKLICTKRKLTANFTCFYSCVGYLQSKLRLEVQV